MKLLEVLDYMFSVQQDFSLTKILQIYPESSLIELCRKYESYTTSKIPNNFRKILKSEYELLNLYINLLTNCNNIYMESQIIEFFFKHFFKRKALIDNLRNTVLLDTNQRKESFEEMRHLYNQIGFYLGSPYQWMEDEAVLTEKRKTLEKLLEIIELDTEMIQLFNYLNLYKPIFEFLIKEKNLISKCLNKENKNNFEENIVEISKLCFEILTVFSRNTTLLPGYLLSRIKFLFNIYKSEVGDVGNLNLFITVLRMIQKQQGNFAVEMFLRQLCDPISFINPSSITKVLKVFWEFIKEEYFNPLIFDLFVTTFTPYLERCMQNLPGVVTYNGKNPTSEDSILTIENIHMIYLITSVFCESKDNTKHSDLFLNFEMTTNHKPRTRLSSKYLISKIGEIFTLENINICFTKLCVVLAKLKEVVKGAGKEITDNSGWNTKKAISVLEDNKLDVKIKAVIFNFIKIYKIVEGNSHDMSFYWNSFINNAPDEKEMDSENDSLEIEFDFNESKISFQKLYKLKRNMISKIVPQPNMKYDTEDLDHSRISVDEELERFNNEINNQLSHLNKERAGSFNQDDLFEDNRPKVKKYMTFRNRRLAKAHKGSQNKIFNFSILKAKNSVVKNINEVIEKDEDVENIERYEREEYDELITNSFKYLEKDKDFRDSVIFEKKISMNKTLKTYQLVPNSDTFMKSNIKREHKALRKLKIMIKKFKNYIENYDQNSDINIIKQIITFLRKFISKYNNKMSSVQDFGVTTFILNLMCRVDNSTIESIIPDLLLYINTVMKGFESVYQERIFKFLSKTLGAENIFRYIHSGIARSTNFLKATIKIDSKYFVLDSYSSYEKIVFEEQALELLRLLCEGHNEKFQTFMVNQPIFRRNYDMIKVICECFEILSEKIIEITKCYDQVDILELPIFFKPAFFCLRALQEFCQGPCRNTQKALIETSFIQSAEKILRVAESIVPDSDDVVYLFLIQKLIGEVESAILALMEAQDEFFKTKISYFISRDLLDNVMHSSFKIMKQFYPDGDSMKLFFNVHEKIPETEDDINLLKLTPNKLVVLEMGFSAFQIKSKREFTALDWNPFHDNDTITASVFIFLRFMNSIFQLFKDICCISCDLLCRRWKDKQFYRNTIDVALKCFSDQSVSVEILNSEGTLETYHFPKIPICNFFKDQMEKSIRDEADRTSSKSKINSIIEKSHGYLTEMEVEYQFSQVVKNFTPLYILSKHEETIKDFIFLLAIFINLMLLLSIKNVMLSDTGEQQLLGQVKQTTTEWLQRSLIIFQCSFTLVIVSFILIRVIILKVFVEVSKSVTRIRVNIIMWIYYKIKFVVSVLSDFVFLYYLGYVTFTFLALFYNSLFATYQLLDVVVRSSSLLDILRSVWNPRKQLFLMLVFFLAWEYVFSLFIFQLMVDDIPESFVCESLLKCFFVIIDWTFKGDGGIGTYMNHAYPQTEGDSPNRFSYGRILFDNLFFLVLVILLIQILSGIIIDTFAKLREKRDAITEDDRRECFLCGKTKEVLEREFGSDQVFALHVMKIHSIKNYIFFLAYLSKKPKNEMNGLESYVLEKWRQKDNRWFPCFFNEEVNNVQK